jgi:CO dehydrogenase/acetyl-CoA synthase delta subunit
MKELLVTTPNSDMDNDSCCSSKGPDRNLVQLQPLNVPIVKSADDEAPCCGPKPGPPSSPFEKPGYRILPFVTGFVQTEIGPVPKVATDLQISDFMGKVRARLGISRDRYRVAPGLYAVNEPGLDAPVLVTANYKLSFDSLRRELGPVDAWILVLDTRGVNVWCAAGKKTFSTEEIIRQVKRVELDRLVSHRELILPQLGVPGVSSQAVKKGCGFKVVWGPIRARDLQIFLSKGHEALAAMRQLTFTLPERIVLIPVELSLIIKPSLAVLLGVFVLSGIGPDIFSFSAAWFRGLLGATGYLLGILAGAVAVPILLPWLPMKQFYLKGIVTGLIAAVLMLFFTGNSITVLEAITLLLLTTTVSSYAAMNFTGATPFTSPSGVEKEMRRAIPVQLMAVAAAIITWIAAPFVS